MEFRGNPEDDIRAGNPEEYFDYLEAIYGHAFRAGSLEAIGTFYLLWQQILLLGNERSVQMFIDRFSPMLPLDARRELLNEYFAKGRNSVSKSGKEG